MTTSISTADISAERSAGEYPLDIAGARFREHGLIVLRELLPSGSKEDLRSLLEAKLHNAALNAGVIKNALYPNADFLLGDILAIRELEKYDYIFFRDELLQGRAHAFLVLVGAWLNGQGHHGFREGRTFED